MLTLGSSGMCGMAVLLPRKSRIRSVPRHNPSNSTKLPLDHRCLIGLYMPPSFSFLSRSLMFLRCSFLSFLIVQSFPFIFMSFLVCLLPLSSRVVVDIFSLHFSFSVSMCRLSACSISVLLSWRSLMPPISMSLCFALSSTLTPLLASWLALTSVSCTTRCTA